MTTLIERDPRGFEPTLRSRAAVAWLRARIDLADAESFPGLHSILDTFPEGGAFIVPTYWVPEHKAWTVALGGTFLPYDNTMHARTSENTLPASRIAHAAAIEAGLAKANAKQFRAEPFYLLPELYDQVLASYDCDREKAYAQIMLDSLRVRR